RSPFDKVHHDTARVLFDNRGVHADDIWMRQGCKHDAFLAETEERTRVGFRPRKHDLQRYTMSGRRVLCLEHAPHTAGSDLAHQPVPSAQGFHQPAYIERIALRATIGELREIVWRTRAAQPGSDKLGSFVRPEAGERDALHQSVAHEVSH